MDARDIVRIHRERFEAGELPEICFLNEESVHDHLSEAYELVCNKTTTDFDVKLKSFEWSGTWSGNSYDFLVMEVAPLIKGHVKVEFVWEDENSTVLEIKDGKVKRS